MLPFLEPKKITSVIIARHGKPDLETHSEEESPDSDLDPGMKMAAEDVMRAFESKSVIDLAKALHSAFQIFDSMPHEEGPHEEEEE
jgi:hypothetical protein